jgi:hypothetical protein
MILMSRRASIYKAAALPISLICIADVDVVEAGRDIGDKNYAKIRPYFQ